MTTITANNLVQAYKNEYLTWRENKKKQEAKRQEYLRRNPNAIKDYDLQRAKTLLKAVDMVDKRVSLNTDHFNTFIESATSLTLGYATILGATLGMLLQKLKFVKKSIDKIVKKHPKSSNIISTGITTVCGVLSVVAAYPLYAFLSNIEAKIDRKKRFETMENELYDPKIFAVLDSNQKSEFNKNLKELDIKASQESSNPLIKKGIKNFRKNIHELLNYDKEQNMFRKKYEVDESFYENILTEKEIKDAKKDRVLLCILIKELNTSAQSYTEKMQRLTDNMITTSFALGSIFSLVYESIAKKFNLRTLSIPTGMNVFLMLATTFFATWGQKRASHIGRFKAKQDLMQNPERLVYISRQKTLNIDDSDIEIEDSQKISNIQFLKDFYQNNKEYEVWKKTPILYGKDISRAMKDVKLSSEQIQDGKRLKTNMFKTFYKVDSNTQNFSSQIDLLRESVKYPVMLVLGTLSSILGVKHLVKIRSSNSLKDISLEALKYIGTTFMFTLPALFINSYFAKVQKMGARISDMLTMDDLEDYRFFADYSRFKNSKL